MHQIKKCARSFSKEEKKEPLPAGRNFEMLYTQAIQARLAEAPKECLIKSNSC
jgi:hypothetical protein